MATRKCTPADAGVLAANLLVDACQTDPDNSLRLGVVSSLALDLGRRLETLATGDSAGSLIEASLACADLAACNLQAISDDNRPLAASAVHLSAGSTRVLIPLIELEAAALDEPGAENTLRDARSARWRAHLAVRQVED
jgi:hypothetical protein